MAVGTDVSVTVGALLSTVAVLNIVVWIVAVAIGISVDVELTVGVGSFWKSPTKGGKLNSAEINATRMPAVAVINAAMIAEFHP